MKLGGIYPALLTPFDTDGRLNEAAVPPLIEHLLEAGVDGFYVGGSTGEGLLMHLEERRRLTEAVVDAARGAARVIVHVGAPATADAVALAEHAARAGADAVSTLPPLFFRVGEDAVVEHYRRVAAAGLPLLAYHIPALTGQRVTPELMRRLAEVPGFAGLKFTDNDFYTMRHLIDDTAGRWTIFNGSDEILLCGLVMGADGGIGSTYNLMPQAFVSLFRAFRAGDLATAQEMQFRITRAVRAIIALPGIGALKAAMAARGLDLGTPRLPLPAVPLETGRQLAATVERLLNED
ncbi:MAG: N-acetylneuraminate lyase [Armatimonadetes bacterium]|nr:N-acetylneuraminate lyase [Armatimonadota bacterium]